MFVVQYRPFSRMVGWWNGGDARSNVVLIGPWGDKRGLQTQRHHFGPPFS